MFGRPTRWGIVGRQLLLTVLALMFVAPLAVMFQVSLRGEGLANYRAVLGPPMIPRFFLNSVIFTASTIACVYVVTALAAYAFAKLELRAKGPLFNAILVGLMIPAISLIVPLFVLVRTFHLFDSYLALILTYTAFALRFTLLLMRNFLDGVPDELLDAARIDGGTTLTTLFWIVLPLAKPISVVVVVWTFLTSWNEYFMPLVFMRNQSHQVITQAPQFFTGVYTQDTGKIFAALVLISLPVMIAYLSLQKYFEDGMVSGSLK